MSEMTVEIDGTVVVTLAGERHGRRFTLEAWASMGEDSVADRNFSIVGGDDTGTAVASAAVEICADALRDALDEGQRL